MKKQSSIEYFLKKIEGILKLEPDEYCKIKKAFKKAKLKHKEEIIDAHSMYCSFFDKSTKYYNETFNYKITYEKD